jgi:hypothetical protein
MTQITQEQAWIIVRQFAREIGEQLADQNLAVVLIGSLAAGTYRPGRSDIDTAIITRNAVTNAGIVAALAQSYWTNYHVPKGFGAVVLHEQELYPPYEPTRGLVKEVLRLKQQGIVLCGHYDLKAIPEPSEQDFRADARIFYPWLRANYVAQRPEVARTVDATINTLLEELRLYIWDRDKTYLFDKRVVIPRFLTLCAEPKYRKALQQLQAYFHDDEASMNLSLAEKTLQSLSRYVRDAVPWSRNP